MTKEYYTLRTNIDGVYTVRIDKSVDLNTVGLLFSIKGFNQLYTFKTKKNELKEKINLIQDVKDNNIDKYLHLRKYDKQAEFEMLNVKELDVFKKENYFTYCEFNSDVKAFMKAKYNFELNGIPLAVPKVDKGQMVSFENEFYQVVDILKPEQKGEPKKIIVKPIESIQLQPITRVYKGINESIEVMGEFEDYLDALLAINDYYRKGVRVHL